MHAKHNHGDVPLHLAAVAGATDVMLLLVQTGADVNAGNPFPLDSRCLGRYRKSTRCCANSPESWFSIPSWMSCENALGQFLSLSPCPIMCYCIDP